MSKLGQRIEALRTKRGLTQRELARQAGIGHTIIAGLESGSRRDVRTDTAKRIARVLGTSVDYLIGTFDEDDESDLWLSDIIREIFYGGAPQLMNAEFNRIA